MDHSIRIMKITHQLTSKAGFFSRRCGRLAVDQGKIRQRINGGNESPLESIV
jgi:hypothetical protein